MTRALADVPLVPHALPQLHALLETEFVADPTPDGSYAVRSTSYEPIRDFVAKKLADPNFNHFRSDRKSAELPNPAAANSTPATPLAEASKNFGHQLVERAIADRQARTSREATRDPAVSMAAPFGLKRAK